MKSLDSPLLRALAPENQAPPDVGPGDALLLVDVQRDFLPGGRLPSPAGAAALLAMARATEGFQARGLPVFVSRDWHPRSHRSFLEHGGRWPVHGLACSAGAALALPAALCAALRVVPRGVAPHRECLSAFDSTTLAEDLRVAGVRRLFVAGLAAEHGLWQTVLDALAAGHETHLLADGVATLAAEPQAPFVMLQELLAQGARCCESAALAALPARPAGPG